MLPTVYEGLHTLAATGKGLNDLSVPVWVEGDNNLVFRMELGRGDAPGSVVAVGGAGRTALQEGARRAGAKGEGEEAEEEVPAPILEAEEPEEQEEEPDQGSRR